MDYYSSHIRDFFIAQGRLSNTRARSGAKEDNSSMASMNKKHWLPQKLHKHTVMVGITMITGLM